VTFTSGFWCQKEAPIAICRYTQSTHLKLLVSAVTSLRHHTEVADLNVFSVVGLGLLAEYIIKSARS